MHSMRSPQLPSSFNSPCSHFWISLQKDNKPLWLSTCMNVIIYPSWMFAAERKLMAVGNNAAITPDIVVAQDGSDQFRTIQEAVNSIPVKNTRRYTVYVKAGVYNEHVIVNAPNVFMYGDGARRTRVVGDKHFPIPTSQTATFNVLAPGFLCKNMGFSNTAGPQGHQAVALLVAFDMSAFFNCRMDGYQDTLYSKAGRQFYGNCIVFGTVDFFFGDAATILQNCLIIVRHQMRSQMNTITAHVWLQQNGPTSIVIQNNCNSLLDSFTFVGCCYC